MGAPRREMPGATKGTLVPLCRVPYMALCASTGGVGCVTAGSQSCRSTGGGGDCTQLYCHAVVVLID